ncbi:MAG: hypothetical protein GY861_17525 [bacterium]|nr:hypothetical protein [bacterium]
MENEVLNSKLEGIKLFAKLQKMKKAGMEIQTLLFPKGKFSAASATKWAKSHGYKAIKTHITEKYIRVRQKPPGRYNIFRTINLKNGGGIKAVIAKQATSKFAGYIALRGISKFSAEESVKSDTDIEIPMKVELRMLCEGKNRDGRIRREDLEESIKEWAGLPIIDYHDMGDMKNPTQHKISDRIGYVGDNPKLRTVDGKKWITCDGFITDRYLAYLIYLADSRGRPLDISPEFGWTPYYINGQKIQSGIRPHLISIVDKGHLPGRQMVLAS